MACMFYFARCMNIIFDSLLAQLVKYDVYTTRKIKSIHAIFITYYYYYIFSSKLGHSPVLSVHVYKKHSKPGCFVCSVFIVTWPREMFWLALRTCSRLLTSVSQGTSPTATTTRRPPTSVCFFAQCCKTFLNATQQTSGIKQGPRISLPEFMLKF